MSCVFLFRFLLLYRAAELLVSVSVPRETRALPAAALRQRVAFRACSP